MQGGDVQAAVEWLVSHGSPERHPPAPLGSGSGAQQLPSGSTAQPTPSYHGAVKYPHSRTVHLRCTRDGAAALPDFLAQRLPPPPPPSSSFSYDFSRLEERILRDAQHEADAREAREAQEAAEAALMEAAEEQLELDDTSRADELPSAELNPEPAVEAGPDPCTEELDQPESVPALDQPEPEPELEPEQEPVPESEPEPELVA